MIRFLATLMLLVSTSALAGTGFHAGWNFANFSWDPSQETSTKTGLIVGAHYDFELLFLTMEPGIQFAQRGYTLETATTTRQLGVNYLEIPVMAKFSVMPGPISPFIVAGPNFGLKVGKSCSQSGTTPCSADDSDVKSTHVGLEFGAGSDLYLGLMSFSVSLRYLLGLTDLSDKAGLSAKHKGFELLLGLTF